MTDGPYVLEPIGWVESPLVDRDMAPLRGDEGSPDAWLVFEQGVREGLRGLQVGTDVIVLTWLDRARRDILVVHPRGDPARPQQGVFSTRSPDRPNPVGLHRVTIEEPVPRQLDDADLAVLVDAADGKAALGERLAVVGVEGELAVVPLGRPGGPVGPLGQRALDQATSMVWPTSEQASASITSRDAVGSSSA